MFQSKDITLPFEDLILFFVWLPYIDMQFPYMEVRHFSLPYTGLAWLYMEVRHQNILQQGGNESGLQMLISFVWNIFTL